MNNSYSSDSASFGQAHSPAGDRGGRPASRGSSRPSSSNRSRGPRSSGRLAMPRMEKGGNQLERPKGSVYQYGKFRYLGDESSPSSAQPRRVSINPADYGYVPRHGGAARGPARGGSRGGDRAGMPEFTVSSSAKFARRPGSAPSRHDRPVAPRSADNFNFKDGYDNRGGFNPEMGFDRGPSREESISSPRPMSRGGYGGSSYGQSGRGGYGNRGGFGGGSRGPARGGFGGGRGPS